jgi:signal transduction histidine kinase/streptogramin lyase
MPLAFRISVFLILCLFPFVSIGQTPANNSNLFFEQPYALQRADINSVTCIFKDTRHIMWFGTENGLYRFDGVNLHYFGHKAGDTASLPDSKVEGITEDKNGGLWVALQKGIAVIDLNTLQCKTFTGVNGRLDERNYTNRICIDDSGIIWVGNNLGIFRFDKKNGNFLNVWNNKVPAQAMSAYVTSIVTINKNLLVASTFNDLIFFNKNDHSFKRFPLTVPGVVRDTTISSLLLDSKQKLWIGTWNGGVYVYDIGKKELSHCNILQSLNTIPNSYVTSFYETRLNKQEFLWISTSTGLFKCEVDGSGTITEVASISNEAKNKYSILPGILEGLYFDSDMALWCCGENGVCKCFPFQNNFKPFTTLQGQILDIEPVKINNTTYYFINSWNADKGKGFLLADTTGKEAPYNIDPHFDDPNNSKNIFGIIKDKYNRFWIASLAGVSVLNDKFELIKQWNKNSEGKDSLTNHHIDAIAIHNDTVWMGSYSRGIDMFDLSFKKIGHFSDKDNSGLEDNMICSFFNDSKGNLWVRGNNKLYKYLPVEKKFKSFRLSPEPAGCNPGDIAETKTGNFIIASKDGLIQFNPSTNEYAYIHSNILDKEQFVNSVAVDKNDEIWFLTAKHLVHYKPKENRFILFGKEDGLDVSRGDYALRTFNGTDFYLCQDNRVLKFNCDSLYQTNLPPYLVLSMQVNDNIVYTNNYPALPYNKNKIQFEFTGVSYIKADQNQYYYQLSDVDKKWNITYKNAVSYANLSPGTYTFKVKTVNYAGLWSEEKLIHFIITPPYWQTWWFRLITTFVVVLILYFIIRYISQRNLKEKILQLEKVTAIEKERNRIAQDMHDDLGSGLTRIAIMSEVVKNQLKQPGTASVQLDRISDSSRTLVDNLQDIIWMLNTKHDQLDSLAIYIREYATKFFEQSAINVVFDYPAYIDPVKIREDYRRNFFLAIKEALNNIVKHANAKNVMIKFSIEQKIMTLVASDDGKGFNMEAIRKFANGVKNMQVRMEQSGGTCSIVSRPGEGTTISFSLCL